MALKILKTPTPTYSGGSPTATLTIDGSGNPTGVSLGGGTLDTVALTYDAAGTAFGLPVQKTTFLDSTNPRYCRSVVVTQDGILLSGANGQAGIKFADLLSMLATAEPKLTWPPVITTQPVATTIDHTSNGTISVVASAEITISYQWQVSTDSGATWANLSNAGVYSDVTTDTLTITNPTTSTPNMSGYRYRCVAYNLSGYKTSTEAILTVT